jgi:guanine deaminase
MEQHIFQFLREAIDLSIRNVESGNGGPFGAIVVKDGKVIGKGVNNVTSHKDPTAHAEVVAIREACQFLNDHQLTGCEIYCSCEPCPMCLGAIYWARPDRIYFANTKEDAAAIQFDDHFIYQEIELPYTQRSLPTIHVNMPEAKVAFEKWMVSPLRIEY